MDPLWKKICRTVRPLALGKGPYKVDFGIAQERETQIDLHGMTIQTAYERVQRFLNDEGELTIITGNGKIADEMPFWLEGRGRRYQICNGGGAFLVLKATRPKQKPRASAGRS